MIWRGWGFGWSWTVDRRVKSDRSVGLCEPLLMPSDIQAETSIWAMLVPVTCPISSYQ